MKRVSYAGESFLTTDSVADALVDLTAALGRSQNADVVEVPAVDTNGDVLTVRLVVGPASQLSAVHVESGYPDPDTGDTVGRLQDRVRTLDHPNVATMTPAPDTSIFEDEDLE
ncbi:hypothetical protein [Glaciibacter sp. 2TAF33]|uniref:hypothetical protein n=1 Tax=Glaciibacter sp. 2TAF33 TaxID=3233015 RepID=UPI003F8DFE1D